MTYFLQTPISIDQLRRIRTGDILYLSGTLTTCRDVGHRRITEEKIHSPVDFKDGAILHAGPIVKKTDNGYEMISIGPTTSMRMEAFEADFIAETGVRVIIGKGGMGSKTADACRCHGAIHCIYPAGCAVLAATKVERIDQVYWADLGMPESLWVCRVKKFGPLIVSIDTEGNNLFADNYYLFEQQKDAAFARICNELHFIK